MLRKNYHTALLSYVDKKRAQDKRTKLYRVINGVKPEVKKEKKPPTDAQAKQRLRFGMVTAFVKHLKQMSDIGLNTKKMKISISNFLTQSILKNAVIGDYPNFTLDYAKVALSDGRLDQLGDRNMSITTHGTLMMTWKNCLYAYPEGNEDDAIFVLIYNATDKLSYNFSATALRSDRHLTVNIPAYSKSNDYHIWMFVSAPNYKNVSRTVYFNATLN